MIICVLENEGLSIVSSILGEHDQDSRLTQEQLSTVLEYLAIQLSIRDRDGLTTVLCHHQPDLFTSSIRLLVTAYEPVIRALHKAVDLSDGVSDLQAFLADLIKLSRTDDKAEVSRVPSVEDFCLLLRRHARSSHRFVHQVLKNSPELSHWYHAYAGYAASQYKRSDDSNEAAGDFTQDLLSMYFSLAEGDRDQVSQELAAHAQYLADLAARSTAKFEGIVGNLAHEKRSTSHGPGVYISKWEGLMDETLITPENDGQLRHAQSRSVQQANLVDVDGTRKSSFGAIVGGNEASRLLQPDCRMTIRLLVPSFRQRLAGIQAS